MTRQKIEHLRILNAIPLTGRIVLVITAIGFVFLSEPGTSSLLAQSKSGLKRTSPKVDPRRLPATQPLAAVAPQASLFPLDQTFQLSSRAAATKTIYLDFTGHSTKDTDWNDATVTEIVTKPFSLDSADAFSNAELTVIQEIWARVSECYSPFDVNVTTKEPPLTDLMNAGAGDTRWGVRVLIGESDPSPAPNAGGVAFLFSFTSAKDTPCFVFPSNLSLNTKAIADASVHEVGHTLGLNHDGRTSPLEEYYAGQGSGVTAWAPHMGVGYYVNLVQWSKGEYSNANNKEDDLQIITTSNGFTYRVDDFPNGSATAAAIGGAKGAGANLSTFFINQSGVIERTTDTDWFKIVCNTGTLTLNLTGGPFNTMLDAKVDVYNGIGQLVVSSNPTNLLTASISQSIPAGTYYISVDGVGKGDPLTTGYTEYSSLGQYTLTGSYALAPATTPSNVNVAYTPATKKLTLIGDGLGNSVSVSYTGGVLKVEGANGTKINTTQTSVSYSIPTSDKPTVEASMGGGDDAVSFTGVNLSTAVLVLGDGNDRVAFTLSNVENLSIDGGGGQDTLIKTSSTIGQTTLVQVP